MNFKTLKYLIYSDAYGYSGEKGLKNYFKVFFLYPGFRFSLFLRICTYLSQRKITKYSIYIPARIILKHYSFKFGFDIPDFVQIGSGFTIAHFGSIIINGAAKIGKNCKIFPGVLIGETSRGKHIGAPVIGDNVHIAAGVKIIGGIKIGNNVAIGFNSVVTNDIPNNAVVVGMPAKIISYNGSKEFIVNTDY
jgi:serine O-acetyltransferase